MFSSFLKSTPLIDSLTDVCNCCCPCPFLPFFHSPFVSLTFPSFSPYSKKLIFKRLSVNPIRNIRVQHSKTLYIQHVMAQPVPSCAIAWYFVICVSFCMTRTRKKICSQVSGLLLVRMYPRTKSMAKGTDRPPAKNIASKNTEPIKSSLNTEVCILQKVRLYLMRKYENSTI